MGSRRGSVASVPASTTISRADLALIHSHFATVPSTGMSAIPNIAAETGSSAFGDTTTWLLRAHSGRREPSSWCFEADVRGRFPDSIPVQISVVSHPNAVAPPKIPHYDVVDS